MESKKVCVVTGGSKGLGYEICREMVEKGFRVINVDKELPDNTETTLPKILNFQADISSEESINEFKERLGDFGVDRIDILINNASKNDVCWFEELTLERFMSVIDVNIKGYFLVTHTLLPLIKKGEGQGTIVNVASHSAWKPMTAETAYNMSKSAQLMMSKQLAREFSKLGYKTTVFCVSPNKLAGTPMSDKMDWEASVVRGWDYHQNRKIQVEKLLAKEETDPKRLAEYMAFLLEKKERHKYLTGCNMEYGD